MKIIKFILVLVLAITFIGCNCQQKENKSTEKTAAVVSLITVSELEKVANTVQLIDVRTPEEYNEGYIKNAKNINFFEGNFIEEMSKLNKEEPIYIYCKSGGRSGSAAKKLKSAGFTKVYDLDGGFLNWKSKGKEISK